MNTLEFPDVKDPDAVIRGVKSYTIHPDYNPKISNVIYNEYRIAISKQLIDEYLKILK